MSQKASKTGMMSTELGKQIAKAMIDAGISTNKELAQLTGISQQSIGRILNGTKATSADEYMEIAHALGLTFIELIARAEQNIERREKL